MLSIKCRPSVITLIEEQGFTPSPVRSALHVHLHELIRVQLNLAMAKKLV